MGGEAKQTYAVRFIIIYPKHVLLSLIDYLFVIVYVLMCLIFALWRAALKPEYRSQSGRPLLDNGSVAMFLLQ
jgi:hypothetical protein